MLCIESTGLVAKLVGVWAADWDRFGLALELRGPLPYSLGVSESLGAGLST